MKRLAFIFILCFLSYFKLFAQTKKTITLESSSEQIYSFLLEAKVKSLTEALTHFSQDYFKEGNFLLVLKSRSIQPASSVAPRVLLFGQNDEMRMSFNHKLDPERKLEIIEWNKKKKIWDYKELYFENSKPVLSSRSKNLCLTCHDKGAPKVNKRFHNKFYQGSFIDKQASRKFLKERHKDKIYSRFEL